MPASARPLSRAEVRAIDRRAIEEFGIPGVVLMENAGRGAAQHILDAFGGAAAGLHVIICGPGNNGGDGFVIARHLANGGVSVHVLTACEPERIAGDARINYEIVRRMGLPMSPFHSDAERAAGDGLLHRAGVVVDALLGTGFSGVVREPLAEIIETINSVRGARVVAVDLPSGLDCDSGGPAAATIRAELTVSFVAPKLGFSANGAAAFTGRVVIVDIGAPAALIGEMPG